MLVIEGTLMVLHGWVVEDEERKPVEREMLDPRFWEIGSDEFYGVFVEFKMADQSEEGQYGYLIIVGADYSQALHAIYFLWQSLYAIVIDANLFQIRQSRGELGEHVVSND